MAAVLLVAASACSPPASPAASGPSGSGAGTAAPSGEVGQAGAGRPATITLTLSGTHASDGSYTSNGSARVCGNAAFDLTGNVNAFNVNFPFSGAFEIRSVSFSADDLPAGTTTPLFHLSVSVLAKLGGTPPATVLDPNQPGSGDTGTAQRTEAGGTTTLVVKGTNAAGETIDMKVICGPKQG
jgi:hypothetical protein